MKNLQKLFLLISIAFLMAACSSSQPTAISGYDDVYFSSPTKMPVTNTSQATAPSNYSQHQNMGQNPVNSEGASRFDYTERQPASSSTTTEDGKTYVTNNYYYDPDDYYDYAYTSRLRRFYHPYGWGYYDSYYTNMYWYDYNPVSWGISIYSGYNWWAPSWYYYSPFTWGFNISFGWPHYSGWGFQPYWYWNSPYYSPYYSYWNGYNQGYWNGYWNGYYSSLYGSPYYYNSFDYNSFNNYYYGPRRNVSSSGHSAAVPRKPLAELYQRSLGNDNPATPIISTVSSPSGNISKPGNSSETLPVRQNSNVNDVIVKPSKQNSSGVDQYTPAPVIKNNASENQPVRSDKVNDETVKPTNQVPSRADEYTPAPTPKQQPNQMESTPRPRQNYQYESTPPSSNPKQMESTPRPRQNYQYESTPPSSNPKQMESTPRPRQNYQYESTPPSSKPKQMESNPRPRQNYQYESTPPSSKPKQMESNPRPRQYNSQPDRSNQPIMRESRPQMQLPSYQSEPQPSRSQPGNSNSGSQRRR